MLLGDAECGQHRRAGDASRSRACNDYAHVSNRLALNVQPIEEGRSHDDGGSVLIVMKYRNWESVDQSLLNFEALGGLDILEIDASERWRYGSDNAHELFGMYNVEFQIKRVDVRQSFEQK